MNKYIEADTDPAAWKITYVSADGTNKTAIHGHNAIGDYKAIDAGAKSEPLYALAQPVQAESKPCFMCHGQGWHYIAHAYPPGVTVPKVKIACTQCVVQPVQPVVPRKPMEAAIAALKRFEETCSDDEGYDLPSTTMHELAAIGLVYKTRSATYCITDFGISVLAETKLAQPVQLATVDAAMARLENDNNFRNAELRDIRRELTAIAQPVQPADAADAARYRWLRQSAYIGVECNDPEVAEWNQKYLNSTIDAAMRETK